MGRLGVAPSNGLIMFRSTSLALLIGFVIGSVRNAEDSSSGFASLFNGVDLTVWEGDAEAWAVRNGAITCLGSSAKKNWLIWRGGEPGDFELRLRFEFVKGNSGVQLRSTEVEKEQVRGYQAEVVERAKMGMWHHSLMPAEHRHYLSTAGQRVRIDAAEEEIVEQVADAAEVQATYHESKWNDLVIVASSLRLVQSINGVVFSDLIDQEQPFATKTGIIAFQDHGKGSVAQFKDIRLKKFPVKPRQKRVSVASVDELTEAASDLEPGTILELAPGTYELTHRLEIEARGAEDQPVVIRAAQPGKTLIAGDGEIIVDGLSFHGVYGLDCQHSKHVRITNCRFHLKQTGRKNTWVGFIDSRHGRVDHCEFAGREDPGSYVHISRGNRFFRIDHNYFHDFKELGYNGDESIYLHGTGVWAIHTVVESNLFERCNNEGELIGIKSHRNIVRNNTFKDCKGAVSIHDGNYNCVIDNVFIALDEPQASGVRIHGKHNAVVNNCFYGVYKPIECCWGETDAPHHENVTGHGKLTKLAFAYRASYDNLIAYNSFVACDTVVQWTKRPIPMEHIRERMGLVERKGPFLAELWERETSKFRHGDFVAPTFSARHWLVLRNVIYDTPQFVRVNLGEDASPPVREEEFQWQHNVAFCNQGDFDVGPERRFDESQLHIIDPGLVEEGPGVSRRRADSVLSRPASINLELIRPYSNQPEVIEALEANSGAGAQGWTLKTRDVI